ncbi:MAG: two-component system activity regulator YycH, partial [Ligilactobacillus agilis]|nr:two-component system activity regulator YycH [Ligilactobacillus agilis]
MRLNLRKYLLVLGLLGAVVISLVFSYLIWINPARSQVNSSTTSSTPNTAMPNSIRKKAGDIYLPTNVVFNDDSKQYRLTSDTLDLTNYTKKELVKWQYEDIKLLPTKTDNTYRRYLRTKNALI